MKAQMTWETWVAVRREPQRYDVVIFIFFFFILRHLLIKNWQLTGLEAKSSVWETQGLEGKDGHQVSQV